MYILKADTVKCWIIGSRSPERQSVMNDVMNIALIVLLLISGYHIPVRLREEELDLCGRFPKKCFFLIPHTQTK